MSQSAIISMAAARVRRGQPAFAYTPTLSDEQGVQAMRRAYRADPPRRRRGPSRLSVRLAGLWLVSGLAIFGALAFTFGAAVWFASQVAAFGGGR